MQLKTIKYQLTAGNQTFGIECDCFPQDQDIPESEVNILLHQIQRGVEMICNTLAVAVKDGKFVPEIQMMHDNAIVINGVVVTLTPTFA